MVDSELGEIPKGWSIKTLGDEIELGYGKALKESMRKPGKVPVYGSNGQVGWHDKKLVDGPGIIVGRKGNPGIITWSNTCFFPIDTTFYVVLKGQIRSMYYLYHALNMQALPSLGADSAVPGLNRNIVYMNNILVPLSNVVQQFDSISRNIYDMIQLNNEQSITLSLIRDSLLPKLMSGEIRVKVPEDATP
jgi:type I restriction enzyme S subunit